MCNVSVTSWLSDDDTLVIVRLFVPCRIIPERPDILSTFDT